jgi:hypothetical protein
MPPNLSIFLGMSELISQTLYQENGVRHPGGESANIGPAGFSAAVNAGRRQLRTWGLGAAVIHPTEVWHESSLWSKLNDDAEHVFHTRSIAP